MTRYPQYLLKITEETVDLVRGLHPEIKSVIRDALKALIAQPYIGKSLKEEFEGLKSYRVKRYRIIYRILREEKHLEIVAIGPRKTIYEETFRLIRKEQGQETNRSEL
jgi:mRNA interferase RelE/StbE